MGGQPTVAVPYAVARYTCIFFLLAAISGLMAGFRFWDANGIAT